MIDLRQEIDKMIENHGIYVLLERASRRLRCVCWNEKYQEADSKCPRCLGEGWIKRIERHKIIRQNTSQLISLPDLIQQYDFGKLASEAKVFFMKHDVHPKANDVIYEVGWHNQKPTHLIRAYRINHVEDMREHQGRIEFYQVSSKQMNIGLCIREFAVRKLGPVKNFEIVRGD